MAFVKKYKEGDKTELPKSKLTYLNVGEYDADELAKTLTLSLAKEADNYQGADKLAFLNYGSKLILAVKDGNVTINSNGSISITGNYGLNNNYTDKLIALMKKDGDVGRGAENYQGLYQKSYGMFTTKGTEDFRHKNHTIGLVGRWLMDNLNSASPIEDKKAETPTKYTFDRAFSDTLLGGTDLLKSEWLKNNSTVDLRINGIIAALKGANYESWGITSEQTAPLIQALEAAKQSKDYTAASNIANSLGFSLNGYLPGAPALTPPENLGESYEERLRKSKEDFYKKYAIDSTTLRPRTREELDAMWQKQLLEWNNLKNYDNALLAYLSQEKSNNPIFNVLTKDLLLTAVPGLEFDMEGNPIPGIPLNNMQAIKDEKYSDLMAGLRQSLLNREGDLNYNVSILINAFMQNPTADWGDYFSKVTSGKYKDFIAIDDSSLESENGTTIIFDPSTGDYKEVFNFEIPGTRIDNYIKLEIQKRYMKKGGILILEDGGGFHKKRNLQFLAKKQAALKLAEELKKAEAAKSKHTFDVLEQVDSEGNPIQEDYFYTDEEGWTPSEQDYARLAGVVGDLVSLGGGWWDLGGVASVGTNAYADFKDAAEGKGTYGEAWSNLGLNTALTVAGVIPGMSSLKAVKGIKAISKTAKVIPWILGSLAAAGTISNALAGVYKKALDNVINDRYSSLDILELASLGQLAASVLFSKGFNLGGIRQRRVSNATEHIRATGDKPSIVTNTGKRFDLTDAELQSIKNAGDSYTAQNEAFRKVQEARLKAEGKPTVAPEGEPAIAYEDLKVGSREGWFGKNRAPKTADLGELHTGSIPTSSTYDDNGVLRTVNTPWGARAMSELRIPFPDIHLPSLGKGEVTGFRNAPAGSTKISDTLVKYQGDVYTKGSDGVYTKETKEAKLVRKLKEKETLDKIDEERLKRVNEFYKKQSDSLKRKNKRAANKKKKLEKAEANRLEALDKKKLHDFAVWNRAMDIYQYRRNKAIRRNLDNVKTSISNAIAKAKQLNIRLKINDYSSTLNDKLSLSINDSFTDKFAQGGSLKFALNALKKSIDKFEDLETLWLKAGGIIFAKKGYKTDSGIYAVKPTNVNSTEIDLPDWLEAGSNGLYDISKLLADVNGNYDGTLSNGNSFIANGQSWSTYDLARRHGDVTIGNSFNRDTRYSMDGINSTPFPTVSHNASHNYNADYHTAALQLEKGEYKDDTYAINGYNQKDYTATDALLKKKRDGEELTDSEKNILLKYMQYLNQANYKSKGNLYFNVGTALIADNEVDSKLTWDNMNADAFDKLWDLRHDGKAGTAHLSIKINPYGTAEKHYLLQEDGTLKEIEAPEEGTYDKLYDDDTSMDADNNYTNHYWKAKGTENEGNELIIVSDKDTKDSELNWGFNPFNLSEIGRAAYTASGNKKAAKLAMDWSPAMKDYLHRMELMEGDYLSLREAGVGRARAMSMAGRNFTSDAYLQLAGQLSATNQGNMMLLDAARKDSLRLYESRHKILDLYNLDLQYNLGVVDYNRAMWSEWNRQRANVNANLEIENNKVWGNLWAGFNKQLLDSVDVAKQRAIQKEITKSGNAAEKAKLLYLKDGNVDNYYNTINEATELADANIGAITAYNPLRYPVGVTTKGKDKKNFLRSMGSIIGIAKKGSKLTATHQYILQGSKDFNKKKLEEAKEFYKNMRKKK